MQTEPDLRAAVLGLAALTVAVDTFRVAAASRYKLSLADTYAISYLDAHGPLPQGALARLMGLTGAGVTGVVDRLERSGTARRVTDTDDRRLKRVVLTESAQEILEESRALLTNALDGVETRYIDALAQVLPHLTTRVTAEAEQLRDHSRT